MEIGTPGYYEMGNEEIPESIGECVEIHAPAGTLIVFGTDVYHRGGRLLKGRQRRILRAHSYPGYAFPGSGDKIRKSARQWRRGEPWEREQIRYQRFSQDGWLELRDFLLARWSLRRRRWLGSGKALLRRLLVKN